MLVEDLLGRVDGPLPAEAEAVRARLADRAALARMRAAPASQDLIRVLLARLRRPHLYPAPLASMTAALEGLLAPLPTADRTGLELGSDALAAAAELTAAYGDDAGEDPAVIVGALVALATLEDHDRQRPVLEHAAQLALAAHGPQPAWADRPLFDRRDPRVWVALHQAASALATGEHVDLRTLNGWVALEAEDHGDGIDTNRLLACCIELARHVDKSLSAPLNRIRSMAYDPAARPTDAVHRETPSPFFALARSLYRSGLPSQAERVIDEWRQQALDTRADDAALREADAALAWLAFRMRWAGYRPTAMSALRQARGTGAALSAALGCLVDGESGLNPDDIIAELTACAPGWLRAEHRRVSCGLCRLQSHQPPCPVC